MSQTAYDDIAAKLGLDSYDVFLRNLPSVSNEKQDVYKAEMEIAAKLIGWKDKWHPHGKGPKKGSVVSGLGMAIHTWGGGGQPSNTNITIHPDGAVEATLRQPGPGDRHPHGDRHHYGRNVRSAAGRP